MSWANTYIELLNSGKDVEFRPKGNSMVGKVNSGDKCTVIPTSKVGLLKVGDIVLCKVKGKQYLHLIKAISGDMYQIGNNRGGINGWVTINSIYGVCIKVEK